MILREFLCSALIQHSFLFQIAFISNDKKFGPIGRVARLKFRDPALETKETLMICKIENKDRRLSISIIHWSKRTIPFLTGRIPNLKRHGAMGGRDCERLEGGADSGLIGALELTGCESREKAGLAHLSVPDNDHFHSGIVIVIGSKSRRAIPIFTDGRVAAVSF
jgi:hypothetical protein